MAKKAKAKPKFKLSKTLQKALDDFPRLVKEEERIYREQEKDIARFDDLTKLLMSGRKHPAPRKKRS